MNFPLRALTAILVIAAAGCSLINPAGTVTPGGGGTATPAPELTTSTPLPSQTQAAPITLTVWVPPQFNPDSGTPAGELLNSRLHDYQSAHDGVIINVRVKALTGSGGLLESLAAADVAAPAVVPSIIALRRTDLEIAALKGLIYPLESTAAGLTGEDWFPYARELARMQDTVFGLPFAGDALSLVYRPSNLPELPATWDQMQLSGGSTAFPAGDPQALVTLALYLSSGGKVQDDQGRPTLQVDVLKQVLDLYVRGLNSGLFVPGLNGIETDDAAWSNFRDRLNPMVITWLSRYLSEKPADAAAALLPSPSGQAYALADGWVWAVSDPQPAQRMAAQDLADYLAAAGFLQQWAPISGFLPVRPSSLDGWTDYQSRDLMVQVTQAAKLRPTNDLVFSLGMPLQTAVSQVLSRQADSQAAAEAAVERVNLPKQP